VLINSVNIICSTQVFNSFYSDVFTGKNFGSSSWNSFRKLDSVWSFYG